MNSTYEILLDIHLTLCECGILEDIRRLQLLNPDLSPEE